MAGIQEPPQTPGGVKYKLLAFYSTLLIEGYTNDADVFFLSCLLDASAKVHTKESTRPSTFAEFGVWHGRCIINVLRNSNSAVGFAIDPFPSFESVRHSFLSNVTSSGENILLVADAGELPAETQFDVVHIDGLHTETAVIRDFESARSMSHGDTVIVFDDVWSDVFRGVTSGVFFVIHRHGWVPFLATSAKVYCCRPEVHARHLAIVKGALRANGLPHFSNFASNEYEQSQDIAGFEVISLKEYANGTVVNWEEKISFWTDDRGRGRRYRRWLGPLKRAALEYRHLVFSH